MDFNDFAISWHPIHIIVLVLLTYLFGHYNNIIIIISLARTPEIGQGLGRILSCGARKPEQT